MSLLWENRQKANDRNAKTWQIRIKDPREKPVAAGEFIKTFSEVIYSTANL